MVENLSKYFGTDPWSYYICEIQEFIMSLDGIKTAGFGLCWLTVSQMSGKFKVGGESKPKTLPYFFIYIVTNIFILSNVGHKEQRFMTAIFPLFHVCWSFLIVKLIKIVPALKKIFRVIFLVYIVHEILITIKF